MFDTSFAADVTIMEEASELLDRIQNVGVLPLFTSCSPAWVHWVETHRPDLIPHLSTCKSPQQMFGAIAKTYYAEKIGVRPEDMVVVSVMPCTAKKYEAARPEMNDSGVQDVDIVLTTRELGAFIKQAGIDFRSLPDEQMDAPLGISTGAADIFANTGGVMEAALRTAWEIVTETPFPFPNLHVEPIEGLEGVKVATVRVEGAKGDWAFLEGADLKVAVAHGLGNAQKVIDQVKNGEAEYHFVEVMTCPGGCIGGGGQPYATDTQAVKERLERLYEVDRRSRTRRSHENADVQALYEELLGRPLGEVSHRLDVPLQMDDVEILYAEGGPRDACLRHPGLLDGLTAPAAPPPSATISPRPRPPNDARPIARPPQAIRPRARPPAATTPVATSPKATMPFA